MVLMRVGRQAVSADHTPAAFNDEMSTRNVRPMNTTPDKPRQGAPRIPLTVLRAIEAIVQYLWNDEFTDYQARTKEARNGHVFRDLLVVRRFLKKIDVADKNQALD